MPYICDRCSLLCSDLSMLKVHMRKHTNEKPFPCHICNRRFAQKGNLNAHLANVHSNHKQFICDICSKQFAQRKTLEKHQIKCGKPSSEESLLKMNNPCQKEYTLKSQVLYKLSSLGNTVESAEFNITSIPAATDRQMLGNNKIIHSTSNTNIIDSDLKKNNNEQIFICDKCDKTFKSKTKLILHVAVHDGVAPKPFVCHICDKGFTHKGSMNAHVRFVHKGEKPFACPTCSKKFSNKCHLKLHARTHSRERPHECETCGKTFSRVEHYRYHLKTHTKKDEIFGCILCDSSFDNANMLRKHVKLHSKNKGTLASIGEGDEKEHRKDSSCASILQEFPQGRPSTFNSSNNILFAAKTLFDNPSAIILKQPLCTATRTDGWKNQTDERSGDQMDDKEPIEKNFLPLPSRSFAGTSLNVISCIGSLKSVATKDITNRKGTDHECFYNSQACFNFVPALNRTTRSGHGSVVGRSTTPERLHGNPVTGTPKPHEITSRYVSNNTNSFEKVMPSSQPCIDSTSFSNNCASVGSDARTFGVGSGSASTTFSFFNSDCSGKPDGQWFCKNFCSNESHVASNVASATNIISNSPLLPSTITGKQLPCLDPITSTLKISSSVDLAKSDASNVMPSGIASQIHQLYRCMECSKKFSSSHHLLNHLRVHSGERPYKCKDCTSCFTQASSLKFHINSVHAGEKKHKCSVCSWTFARMSHLKRHELRHSKEKPYRCLKCSRTFIERSKLRQHLSSHGLNEVTINELLALNPPHLIANASKLNTSGSDETYSTEKVTTDAVISPASGDCSTNEDQLIDISQCLLKQNNQIFSTSKTFGTKAGCGKSAQLIQQLDSVNKVDHLNSEYEKQYGGIHEHSSRLSNSNTIVNSSSVSNIMTRSKAKHSKAKIKGNDLEKKVVGMIQEIRISSVQNSCLVWEEGMRLPISNRKGRLEQDKAQKMRKSSRENAETLPSIENDERRNGRGQKEKNVDDILRLSTDIAMHQDYPIKKKRFEALCSQKKEACPKCEHCGKSFNSLATLRSHSVVHSGLRPYVCAMCDKSFTQNSSLRVHVAVIHNLSRKHQCPHCPKKFSQRSHLNRHLNIHLGLKPFSCEKCDRRFHENNKLMLHKKVHERRERMNKEEKEEYLDIYQLTCKICSKVFLRRSYLNKHMALHGHVNTYQCDRCSKQYRHKSSLEIHMRQHTGEKPFSCEICDERFARSSSLTTHKATHHEVETYKCSSCSQRFNRVSSLASHLAKTHNEVLSEQGDLQTDPRPTHLVIEPRPWACSGCSKRFSHKSILDIHNRVHSGEKPFACPHCNRLFTQKGSLNTHLRSIHNGE